VQYLAGEAGIRQFPDIGTGLPTAGNTHEVAQSIAPESRIVYVNNDPIVLAHALALLTSTPEGATAYLDADLRDTGKIVQAAGGILDFTQPIAVMLVGVLHGIPDAGDSAGAGRQLLAAVAPGSYLVGAHPASDIHTEQIGAAATRFNRVMDDGVTLRTHAGSAGCRAAWTWWSPAWCSCTGGGRGRRGWCPTGSWPTTARSAVSHRRVSVEPHGADFGLVRRAGFPGGRADLGGSAVLRPR